MLDGAQLKQNRSFRYFCGPKFLEISGLIESMLLKVARRPTVNYYLFKQYIFSRNSSF